MAKLIPKLDGASWSMTPRQKVVNAFANLLTSNYSQSTIYKGKVTTLQQLIATYQTDITTMTDELENALFAYYSRFCTLVNVGVVAADITDTSYTLQISINVTLDGEVVSVANAIPVNGGSLATVIQELNK